MGIHTSEQNCPICGDRAFIDKKYDVDIDVIKCDSCGKYSITRELLDDQFTCKEGKYDLDKLASYLYYNKIVSTSHIILSQEEIPNEYARINPETVNNWYPKTFQEKVNMFLLVLEKQSHFFGEPILFTQEQIKSACFVRRNPDGRMKNMKEVVDKQHEFFLNCLVNRGYITWEPYQCTLLPGGFERVDELQKNNSSTTKNVFVAMSFDPSMLETRKAIKQAIIECGFVPRIMDEIEHNHQIVPEMLYEIRKSRFVVSELTGHNNGAYFEAGYALGNGKEVIQICKKDVFGTDGHFDVKQINTVLWDDYDDLRKRLSDRIKATIQ